MVLIIGGTGFYMTRGLNSGESIIIKPIDASQLEDGIYKGNYKGGRWSNEVNEKMLCQNRIKIVININK